MERIGAKNKKSSVPTTICLMPKKNKPDPMLVKVIEYFAEHGDFFKVILGPKGDPEFAVRIKNFLKTQHISKFLDFQPDLAETIVPKDYMIDYFASSNLSILQYWIETGMEQSPTEVASMLTHILGSGVKHLYGINMNTKIINQNKNKH